MTARDALHTDGGVTTAVEARLSLAATLFQPGPVSARTGILHAAGNPLQVTGTSSTSPWQYAVNAGGYVGSKGTLDGVYVGTNDSLVNVSTTAPPASNSRIDVIYIMEQNSSATISPDSTTGPLLGCVQGTAAASPTIPSIPAGAVQLAQATVSSTATAGTSGAGVTISNVAPYTVAAGAVLPCHNSGEYPGSVSEGQVVWDLALHYPLGYVGGAWTPLVDTFATTGAYLKGANAPAGTRKVKYGGTFAYTTNTFGQYNVTFPAAYPSGLTNLMFVPGDTVGGLVSCAVSVANLSLSSGVGYAYNGSGSAITSTTVRVNYLSEGW